MRPSAMRNRFCPMTGWLLEPSGNQAISAEPMLQAVVLKE